MTLPGWYSLANRSELKLGSHEVYPAYQFRMDNSILYDDTLLLSRFDTSMERQTILALGQDGRIYISQYKDYGKCGVGKLVIHNENSYWKSLSHDTLYIQLCGSISGIRKIEMSGFFKIERIDEHSLRLINILGAKKTLAPDPEEDF